MLFCAHNFANKTAGMIKLVIFRPLMNNILFVSICYQASSRISSVASPAGVNERTPPKKPYVGQKKPFEALGSSPPASR